MPELRLNLITREWVIIATERAKRPDEFRQKRDKNIFLNMTKTALSAPAMKTKPPEK